MSGEEWTFIGHGIILGAIAMIYQLLKDKIERVLKIANGKTDKLREDLDKALSRIQELEET